MNTALNDLTNIIRHNQNQPRVYLARAEIYQKQGDITGAILNYSQVSLFVGMGANESVFWVFFCSAYILSVRL